MYLEKLGKPSYIKKLNTKQLKVLAKEIRQFLIQNISKTGGHFSSNLGVVELTMALHYVFSSPKDKYIFDVGHQSYVHKILTGRMDRFSTLRQYQGLSGFQKRKESIHDQWEAGHSSTALSGAIGMAVARDLNHKKGEIIAIVGDAAIMSGESFEALNHIGSIQSKVIIILNDNDMSISSNVGGLSNFLSEVRMSTRYTHAKNNYVSFLNKSDVGRKVYKVTKKVKDQIKNNVIEDNIFGEFGLDYLGPVDGHDINELINVLSIAKNMDHSVVVHVHTQKGRGYKPAENDKCGLYHGVSPFDYNKGIIKDPYCTTWSQVISGHIEKHMDKDNDIVVITPAMIEGSGLHHIFKKYPERSFDVGIAEEHAMTFAAGLSISKKKPYITIYSSFLQRAYDQLNHDIARMNLPCLIGVDRAGLVGEDGETHHGIFDISFLSSLPHVVMMTPMDALEAKKMINTAFHHFDKPYILRFPKGYLEDHECQTNIVLNIGDWKYIYYKEENTIDIITYGEKVNPVLEMIQNEQLPVNLINARFIKPMDYDLLNELQSKNHQLVIYETDIMNGSLGSMIAHYYSRQHKNMSIDYIGIDDKYTPQGRIDQLLEHEKMSINDLKALIEEKLNEKRTY